MIVENNPQIDVVKLKERLASTVSNMPAEPNMAALVGSLRSTVSIHQTSIRNNVDKILELNAPRVSSPGILNRSPLKWVPLLNKVFFLFDSFVFSRQRQTALHLSEICTKIDQQQNEIVDAVELLARRIEAQKDKVHE